ncbi:MAG TPA: oligogalacturonate lyase family protein [Pyrinomonadaceae bacterium]|nr:oligogalacturonate lyase family protein [Pyrinomonadaceae bacterium]
MKAVLLIVVWCGFAMAQDLPVEWIDPDTGHRVFRLSKEPGSTSLYFHQNGYTPDGKKLIIMTPTGLSTVDLKTRAVEKVVDGRVNLIMVGKKTGRAYYVKNRIIFSVDLDTKETKEIAPVPQNGSIASVNADETLLAGAITEPAAAPAPAAPAPATPGQARDNYPGKGAMMERRLAERRPMELFTLNIKTGERKTLHKSTDWLNHIQFSPTDPALLMFCHEGPWHKVDRIWTIRTDGSGLTKIHTRTMNMEIAGHEFFSGDGKTIWYDLQTPKSQVFWVAGYNTVTGARRQYYVPRAEWSVHFNVSPDGKLFAGDGGGPNSVAAPGNGQWIYLFRPQELAANVVEQLPNAQQMIMPGSFKTEKLVNLSKHDYGLEPNVTFSPDMKWIVFRSNMLGPTHIYAVEVEKASVSSR